MTDEHQNCGNCKNWKRISNRIAGDVGVCYAPIPHCVPREHRITRETEDAAGITCGSWQPQPDVYKERRGNMKFRLIDNAGDGT